MTNQTSSESIVQREHALVSPSSLVRIVSCTKSLKINEDYRLEHGETTSEAAKEGTTAHAVAENMVNEAFGLPLQPDSVEEAKRADRAMKICGAAYRDFILRLYQGGGYTKVYTETKIDMTKYISECWGTCDCFLVSPNKITVVDYKYGHALVSATGNYQLRAYSLGAYLSLPEHERKNIQDVEFYIFQPRATTDYSSDFARSLPTTGAISHDKLSVAELKAWAADTNVRVMQAIRNEGQFEAGHHCAFCAGKGNCPATKAPEIDISVADLLSQ